jgi:hypothetical protein
LSMRWAARRRSFMDMVIEKRSSLT